jgi:hypothetical protein
MREHVLLFIWLEINGAVFGGGNVGGLVRIDGDAMNGCCRFVSFFRIINVAIYYISLLTFTNLFTSIYLISTCFISKFVLFPLSLTQ